MQTLFFFSWSIAGEEMKAAETDTSLKNQVEYLMDAMKRLQKEAAVAGEASPEERALIFESCQFSSLELVQMILNHSYLMILQPLVFNAYSGSW